MCNFGVSKGLSSIKNLKILYRIPKIDGIFKKLNLKLSLNAYMQRLISFFCDVIINIGGSIFIQDDSWEYKLALYKKRIIKNKPFYIIGSNFGPFSKNKFLFEYRKIFKQVTDICFRDSVSYSYFNLMKNIRYSTDIVFLLENEGKVLNYKINNYVLISLIDLSRRNTLDKFQEIYLEKMFESSKFFIRKGMNIVLIGFCKNEGDSRAIRKLKAKFSDYEQKYITEYIYKGNIRETLSIISNSKYIIASRFHAMILGLLYKKKVLPIIYSKKSMNLINDIEFNSVFFTIEDINQLSTKFLEKFINSDYNISIRKQIDLANDQFKYLDKKLL